MPADTTPRAVRTLVVLMVVAVIAATALLLLTRHGQEGRASVSGPAAQVSATPTPSPTVAARSDMAPASLSGEDAAEDDTPSPSARDTAATFLDGWLATDRVRRARLLRVSATRELAAELELTDPAAIPPGPVRSLAPVGGSEFSAEFVAQLREMSVRVVLAADPEAPHGWCVVSIEPED
jgi:hypothetical protein